MKITDKQKKILLVVTLALLILFGAYQLGYFSFSQQKPYNPDDADDGANFSPTFDAENIAQSVYNDLDGSTDFEVFMSVMDMLLALSNDELVASYNEYTSLYSDTDFPTMRSNILGEDINNWLWAYPVSGWGMIDEADEARNQVLYRFDQLNLA